MNPVISTETVAQTLVSLGWQQFFLDEQFNLRPPCSSLAQLCGLAPSILENESLLNIFTSSSRDSLSLFLQNLGQNQSPHQITLWLQVANITPRPVELMLYVASVQDYPNRYIGFIRPLPQTTVDLIQAQSCADETSFQKIAYLSQNIARASNLTELLEDVVNRLNQDFGYSYVAIFLTSSSETHLKLAAAMLESVVLKSGDELSVVVDDKTVIGHAILTTTPILCHNVSQSNYDSLDYFSIKPQSEIAVPLVAGKQVLGILDTQSLYAEQYNDEDFSLLQVVAHHLALAIENIRLVKERAKRLIELGTFNQIGMIIAEQRDLDTILSNIVQRVRSLFQVEGVSLLLLEKNNLRFVAAAGTTAEDVKPFVLKPGQGIAWSVVETKETIRVDNVKNDPRHFDGVDRTIGFTTRSLLAVPIRIQDRTLGVLEAMNRIDGLPFNQDDETILEFIVSSVAVAIENARLFDQTRRHVDRVTGLLQASYTLNALDLQEILDTIVQKAGDLLEAAYTVVYLADYETQQIRATATYSVDQRKDFPTPSFDFEQGTAGWVIKHRRPLRINDDQQDGRFAQVSSQSEQIANLIAVPLVVKSEVIGVLEATRKINGEGFTVEDKNLLSAFASQAAIAIHNARLYREKQLQVQALTTLTQTSEAITKAGTLDQLLNIVLNSALSIIGAESGEIILVDPESQILRIEAACAVEARAVKLFNQLHLPKDAGIWGEVYRSRKIVEVKDSDTDSRIFISNQIAWDLPKSFTNVPLVSGQDFIGLMTLHALPNQDNRSLLQAVGDMAAVAIAKARLFDEIGQRLAEVSTLYTLAEQMTRLLDLDRVIEYSVTILKHALDCSSTSLFLKENKSFILKTNIGWPTGSKQLAIETDYIVSLASELTAKPYPIYVRDVRDSPRSDISKVISLAADKDQPEQLLSQMRSIMIVPLVVKDEVIGALSISDKQRDAFGPAEGRLLTIAAAQISTAIENVKLYDNLERRAVELEVALKEVAEANQLKAEFAQNISHELRTPLTFILSYVELILEGTLGEIPRMVRDKLEIVSQKTRVTTRLVDDIISLQKLEAGNLQLGWATPYELITRATYGAMANAAQYGIEIVSRCPPDLPKMQVDVDRIGQVFDNLVTNALKFSPSGSKIYIVAELEGDMVKFSVQDHGIGIPVDKLGKIFERFYQVDGSTTRRYKGTGLGLAIIKQIIEVHGGYITVESVVDEGTTFTFWLPIFQTKRE